MGWEYGYLTSHKKCVAIVDFDQNILFVYNTCMPIFLLDVVVSTILLNLLNLEPKIDIFKRNCINNNTGINRYEYRQTNHHHPLIFRLPTWIYNSTDLICLIMMNKASPESPDHTLQIVASFKDIIGYSQHI